MDDNIPRLLAIVCASNQAKAVVCYSKVQKKVGGDIVRINIVCNFSDVMTDKVEMESDAKASDTADQDQKIQVEASQLVASIVTNVCKDGANTTTTTSRMQEEETASSTNAENTQQEQQPNETNKENVSQSGKNEAVAAVERV